MSGRSVTEGIVGLPPPKVKPPSEKIRFPVEIPETSRSGTKNRKSLLLLSEICCFNRRSVSNWNPMATPSPSPTPAEFEAALQNVKSQCPPSTCPFLGVGTALGIRELSHAEQIQSGGQRATYDLASIFIPCVQERCAMWNQPAGSPGECAVKRGFLALANRMPSLQIPKMTVLPKE